jgi:hypothetical protein
VVDWPLLLGYRINLFKQRMVVNLRKVSALKWQYTWLKPAFVRNFSHAAKSMSACKKRRSWAFKGECPPAFILSYVLLRKIGPPSVFEGASRIDSSEIVDRTSAPIPRSFGGVWIARNGEKWVSGSRLKPYTASICRMWLFLFILQYILRRKIVLPSLCLVMLGPC